MSSVKCANVYKSADCETLYFTKKGSIYSGQYYTTSVHINKWVDFLWYKIANPHGVRKKVQVQRKWPLLSSVSLALILGVPLLECVTVQQALITNSGLYVILLQNAKNTPCFAFAWFLVGQNVCVCVSMHDPCGTMTHSTQVLVIVYVVIVGGCALLLNLSTLIVRIIVLLLDLLQKGGCLITLGLS